MLRDAPSAHRIRVLVIDDPNLFRDGLIKLLSDQPDLEITGFTESSVQAAEQIRKTRPDIVLLGWPANSANAQKVFAAVQDTRHASRLIMLVSDHAKEDFVEAVRQGCCGIVMRQTSTELLLKSIRKVHAGEFWLDRVTTAGGHPQAGAPGFGACRRCGAPGAPGACRGVEPARDGNRGTGGPGFQE